MKQTREKKFFPKIRPNDKCIMRTWYVEYWFLNSTGNFAKRKFYGSINKYETIEARQLAAQKIVDYILKHNTPPPKRPGQRKIKQPLAHSNSSIVWEIAESFISYKKERLRPKSICTYTGVLEHFIMWIDSNFGSLKIEKVTESLAMEYLQSIELGGNTKNKKLVVLKMFFTWAIKRKLIKCENPFQNLDSYCKSVQPYSAYTPEQRHKLKKVIEYQDPQMWLACMMLFYTFIRPGEQRLLKIENIFLDGNKIEIPANVSKNGKHQVVQIPNQLQYLLLDYGVKKYPQNYYLFSHNGKPGTVPVGINYLRNKHVFYLQKASIDNTRYKFYSWKHTGASAAAQAGIPVKDIQLQLRHHSLDQTDQYLKSLGVMDNDRIKNNFPNV